jgi:hypothetical protein
MFHATRPFVHGNHRYRAGDEVDPADMPEPTQARFLELGLIRDSEAEKPAAAEPEASAPESPPVPTV